MEQNNKNKFCTLKTKIIITIMLIILGFLGFFAINTYGMNFDLGEVLGALQGANGNEIQNHHEETLVRMATSLSKGENLNNIVNKDSLTNFLDKYLGSGVVAIQEAANNLLNIQFNNTGNLYQINILSGFLEWIQNLTYKITYDANGGIMLPYVQFGKPAQQITLTNFKPTRSGYTFLGWSTSQNDTTPDYDSEDVYIGITDTILYAVWEEKIILETFTITYNANGGLGAPDTQRITQGESLTIPNVEPTRQGCTFLGWSTNSNATSATYKKGQTYPVNSSMALYAVWQVNGYTVTYNTNGGSGGPAQETVDYGGSVTVSSIEPTKTGYTFKGWDTSSTATTVRYQANDIITNITTNIDLYAVWEINSYKVTYYANGGSGEPAQETVNYGGSVTISTTTPTREGYTFKGWDTSSAATTVRYEGNDTITNITANINLYAVWEEDVPEVTTYTITFDANSGSGAPSAITVNQGDSVTIPDNVPTRSGSMMMTTYTFVGWSTTNKTASATVTADYAPGETIPASEITGNMTLYATYHSQSTWIGTKYYVVLFNQKGGSNGPIALRVQQGQTGTIPTEVPTREGYTFLGWSTDANATTATYTAGSSITPSANTTLYAVWREGTVEYTITFNANGGSGGPSSVKTNPDGTATIPTTTPTRTYMFIQRYTFLGWSKESNATTATYQAGGTIPAADITGDMTLYAVWQAP